MVHGLETMAALNEKEVKKPRFALVSTVDSSDTGNLPSHCVLLFDTEEEAVQHACMLIVEHIDEAEIEYDPDGNTYYLGDEGYSCEFEFLNAFQCTLDAAEYFHVMPIK